MSDAAKAFHASNADEFLSIRLPDKLVAQVLEMVRCMQHAQHSTMQHHL
jgi:hypothetical protein